MALSRFTIAESSHRILDPYTPAKLDELGNALQLTAGMTMLDLACGKGEALCRWAGGIALIGETYWREVPATPDDVAGTGAQGVEQFSTLWDLVEMVLADEDCWDRYQAAQWLNLRRFIDANPADELVPELREELDTVPVKYVRYRRRYWGWGVFALMKR